MGQKFVENVDIEAKINEFKQNVKYFAYDRTIFGEDTTSYHKVVSVSYDSDYKRFTVETNGFRHSFRRDTDKYRQVFVVDDEQIVFWNKEDTRLVGKLALRNFFESITVLDRKDYLEKYNEFMSSSHSYVNKNITKV